MSFDPEFSGGVLHLSELHTCFETGFFLERILLSGLHSPHGGVYVLCYHVGCSPLFM